jgi:hypothetical protein
MSQMAAPVVGVQMMVLESARMLELVSIRMPRSVSLLWLEIKSMLLPVSGLMFDSALILDSPVKPLLRLRCQE